MSCKVISPSEGRLPERIHWKSLDAPKVEAPAAAVDLPPLDNGEMDRLHKRVVELELAMEKEVRQARDRAFEEGQKSGREQAAAEVQPVMDKMLQSCSEIVGMRPKLRRETEADIVTLTLAIAQRVLRRELSVDPEAIHGIVKAALEKIQMKEVCVIRAHPQHVAQIRSFFDKSGIGVGLDIQADPSLQLGGLIIETKRGNLDGSVETQLKEIERGFADRLGN